MQSALDQFHVSISRVRDLISLHSSLKAQASPALDLTDLLRASLVLAVSALDYYIHEVVVLGMLEIYRGQRPEPPTNRNASQSTFSKFKVSMGGVQQERRSALEIASWLEQEILQVHGIEFLQEEHTLSTLLPIISSGIASRLNENPWLEDEIRECLSYESFQKPDDIADAIRWISSQKLWNTVSSQLNKPEKEIKTQLRLIVGRRNKIAHEADIDPTYGIGQRWGIDESMVNDAVNFIEAVVESIHRILEDDRETA